MRINITTPSGPAVLTADAVITRATITGAWWRIQYYLDGEVVYACSSRHLPHGTVPGVLEALDWKRTVKRGSADVTGTNREHLVATLGDVRHTERDRKPVDRAGTQASPVNRPDVVRGVEGSTPSCFSNDWFRGGCKPSSGTSCSAPDSPPKKKLKKVAQGG